MRWIRVLLLRIRAVARGRRLDAETREEIQQHIDRQTEANLAAGMTDGDARRAAVLDVGGVVQLTEAVRDTRGLLWWDTVRADVRYALRQIRRRPGFASAVILTMAIGVGATSAVFAVVDAVVLRPLPYPRSDRLYSIFEINSRSNIGRTRAAALNVLDWQQQAHTFKSMAAQVGTGFTLTGRGNPEFTLGSAVSTNALDVLGLQPVIGRSFQPHETEAGHHRVVILTHGLWMQHFGGDPAVVNQTTTINGEPYTIIGVLPPGFAYPSDDYRLLVPLVTKGRLPGGPPMTRSARFLRVVGRLSDEVSEETARAELQAIGARLATEYPDANETVSIGMKNLRADTVGDAQGNLLVVLSAVAFVLLIACVNVAGLALARGHARRRELAVRTAIGASRARLIRQLATEGLVLVVLGGAAGLTLAVWIVGTFSSALPPNIPRLEEIRIDGRFILLAGGVVLIAGLVSSIMPALQVTRRSALPQTAGSRGVVSATRASQRARAVLLVTQISVAIALLAGASLALRSLNLVGKADPGFNTEQTMTFSFVMRDARYPTAADVHTVLDRVYTSLESTSGVAGVGLTTHLPLADNNLENTFTVAGAPVEGSDPPIAGLRFVLGHYVEAIGARVLEGRAFTAADVATSEPVAIVTRDFARRYMASAKVIGARIKMGGADSDEPWRTVVGVIADIRHAAIDKPTRPEVWMPFSQVPDGLLLTWLRGVYVAVRTTADPQAIVPGIRTAMRAADPDMPLVHLQSMDELARRSTAERRLETSLLATFAAIALGLAGIGLFGILAFHVSQRVPEFGVRLALGATPRNLLEDVLTRALILLAIGLAVGIPGALLIGRAMSALLYGVSPADPIALTASVVAMTVVTLVASVVPARRAMRVDPLTALRTD